MCLCGLCTFDFSLLWLPSIGSFVAGLGIGLFHESGLRTGCSSTGFWFPRKFLRRILPCFVRRYYKQCLQRAWLVNVLLDCNPTVFDIPDFLILQESVGMRIKCLANACLCICDAAAGSSQAYPPCDKAQRSPKQSILRLDLDRSGGMDL